jgi:biotin synthase-related radical SAM superfamily protein
MLNVAIGTAGLLGLEKLRLDVKPTTAHIMIPGDCRFGCSYCPQAMGSHARNALSRISWPTFEDEEVFSSLSRYKSLFQRVCVQVVQTHDWVERALYVVKNLRSLSLPISLATRPISKNLAGRLFDAGIDRLGLPMDVASPRIYRELRSGCFEREEGLIEEVAERFRGRLSTHLIVGLGEREDELVRMMTKLHLLGVTIALFAFTPCPGTKMAKNPAPDYKKYRRVQIARYLIERDIASYLDFEFDSQGDITYFGRSWSELKQILEPSAFMTSGCPGCNRPFYNERPSSRMYNYPKPLSRKEFEEELQLVESGIVK